MSPLYRTLAAVAALATLTACGDDRSVNPVADIADVRANTTTTAGAYTAHYDLLVGQTVRIVPKTTTRISRARWTTSSSAVASVSSTGSVTARTAGVAIITLSGSGVLETYEVAVTVPPPPTVTSFSLQPKTGVTLSAGNTQQFATNTTWSDSQTRSTTVTYTATGGTISSTGLFTAGNVAGTFMVIATCSCTTPAIADTALVSVTVPQLTSLAVSPKTVSVNAGATQQFAVSANWNTGATTVPPVTWSATGGSVSATGLYTAPTAAGTYRVIVAHTNGTVRDTATVTVAAPVAAPTAASGAFFEDGFETGAPAAANGFLWRSGNSTSVSTEKAFSGQYSLRFRYAAADSGKDSSAEQRFDMGRYLSAVWIEYMLYVPDNFVHRNESPNNNKFLMLWRDVYSDATGGTWRVGAEYQRATDGSSTLRFMSSRWDYNYWASNGPWPTGGANYAPTLFSSNGPLTPGRWHRIRFHVKAASSRTAEDGVARVYVDNNLIFQLNNARFHNAYDSPADAVLRNGYLLGWANSGFAQETVFYVDNVKFYQTSPGW